MVIRQLHALPKQLGHAEILILQLINTPSEMIYENPSKTTCTHIKKRILVNNSCYRKSTNGTKNYRRKS